MWETPQARDISVPFGSKAETCQGVVSVVLAISENRGPNQVVLCIPGGTPASHVPPTAASQRLSQSHGQAPPRFSSLSFSRHLLSSFVCQVLGMGPTKMDSAL